MTTALTFTEARAHLSRWSLRGAKEPDPLNEAAGGHVFDNLFGKNARLMFGDPTFPKRNITGGSLIMAVAAFELGTFAQRTLRSSGVRVDYVLLLLVVLLFFIGIKTFRLGMAFVPPDAGNQGTNRRTQRTTVEWIGLVLFWILLIVAPVAIIQFVARR